PDDDETRAADEEQPTPRRTPPRHPGRACRADAYPVRGDRRAGVPQLRLRVLLGGGGRVLVQRGGRAIRVLPLRQPDGRDLRGAPAADRGRSEEHTSELQSRFDL